MVNLGLQSQHCSAKNLHVLQGPGRLTVIQEAKGKRWDHVCVTAIGDLKWIEKTMKRSEWLSQRPTACFYFTKKTKGEFRESVKYLFQIKEMLNLQKMYLQMIIHVESVTD